MTAWWSGTGRTFLQTPQAAIVNALTRRLVENHRTNHDTQPPAWDAQVAILRDVIARFPDWYMLLEYPLIRLGRRIDAVLIADRAIIVLEFKVGATIITQADRTQVEDYALDLVDFHAASRRHPVLPVLVATASTPRPVTPSLPLEGVAGHVIDANAATLTDTLADLVTRIGPPSIPLDGRRWDVAPYRPVPTIIEAATMLYHKHGVAEIAAARADADNLSTTTQAILEAITRPRSSRSHLAIFVTGIGGPVGSGKTLCGLNIAFQIEDDTSFLTGNLPLLHVLREALAQDAAAQAGTSLRVARHKVESTIQALMRFLEHYVGRDDAPHEHVIVFDEAQRAWDAAFGERKFNRHDSEAGLFLDIMARHRDWAVIVALVGNGQEINTGEAGLATWGEALARRPDWQSVAAADIIGHADPARRLFDTAPPSLTIDSRLHLTVSVRQVRADAASAWIDAVLSGDGDTASRIAETEDSVPFLLSRSLADMRAALRSLACGTRRAGLVCSAGASRLRPEGLSCDFPHLDAKAVANWFLRRWPEDVRASDALELPATQFACQGLELDYVGLCWDGDLIRIPGTVPWQARSFRGTRWQITRRAEETAWRVNTYRVLLSRARYETVIFVPEGSPDDRTRPPGIYDTIADFLKHCGARDAKTVLGLDAEPVAPAQHALPAL